MFQTMKGWRQVCLPKISINPSLVEEGGGVCSEYVAVAWQAAFLLLQRLEAVGASIEVITGSFGYNQGSKKIIILLGVVTIPQMGEKVKVEVYENIETQCGPQRVDVEHLVARLIEALSQRCEARCVELNRPIGQLMSIIGLAADYRRSATPARAS